MAVTESSHGFLFGFSSEYRSVAAGCKARMERRKLYIRSSKRKKKRVSKEFQNIKNARHLFIDSILAVLYNVHVGVGGEQKLKRMEMDNMATFIWISNWITVKAFFFRLAKKAPNVSGVVYVMITFFQKERNSLTSNDTEPCGAPLPRCNA